MQDDKPIILKYKLCSDSESSNGEDIPYEIVSAIGKAMTIKMLFENPQYVSMGCQNE
jgi:sporulation protein YlmC with PRC-barrel domain